jgi:hypothetical protein
MRRRIYRIVRWCVILVPALLFISAVVLPQIPGAMGLFSDSAGPWYQSFTSPLFLAALCYGYPVTRLCIRFGGDDMFLSPGYYVVLAIYSLVWVLLLRAIFLFFERRNSKTS